MKFFTAALLVAATTAIELEWTRSYSAPRSYSTATKAKKHSVYPYTSRFPSTTKTAAPAAAKPRSTYTSQFSTGSYVPSYPYRSAYYSTNSAAVAAASTVSEDSDDGKIGFSRDANGRISVYRNKDTQSEDEYVVPTPTHSAPGVSSYIRNSNYYVPAPVAPVADHHYPAPESESEESVHAPHYPAPVSEESEESVESYHAPRYPSQRYPAHVSEESEESVHAPHYEAESEEEEASFDLPIYDYADEESEESVVSEESYPAPHYSEESEESVEVEESYHAPHHEEESHHAACPDNFMTCEALFGADYCGDDLSLCIEMGDGEDEKIEEEVHYSYEEAEESVESHYAEESYHAEESHHAACPDNFMTCEALFGADYCIGAGEDPSTCIEMGDGENAQEAEEVFEEEVYEEAPEEEEVSYYSAPEEEEVYEEEVFEEEEEEVYEAEVYEEEADAKDGMTCASLFGADFCVMLGMSPDFIIEALGDDE